MQFPPPMTPEEIEEMDARKGKCIFCFDNPEMEYEILNEEKVEEALKVHGSIPKYAESKGWKDYRIVKVTKFLRDKLVFMQAEMENIIGDDYDY